MSRNSLAEATSPYLLQHKDNPVHWYPWGPEALAAAKENRKPILLSIGYAACHWCHVMAHESFEDDSVAAVMNERFVNIKVDREERPDIDTIYMNALQVMGQQGGWPLTMFLTPDGEPFWGGTYFPKEAQYGIPGFVDVLTQISRAFAEEPEKIEKNRAALVEALKQQSATAHPGEPLPALLDRVPDKLMTLMDPVHGGIQGAPKFPQAGLFGILWRSGLRLGNDAMTGAVLKALDHMCEGGLYDHLGGGFSRYTVDEAWLVPHFEKMLYDNAQLLALLTAAWAETGKPLYRQRVYETVEWLTQEMQTEGGAFAASLDADSEGEEGKFYVWSLAEIEDALGSDTERFALIYNATAEGNWEGKTILNRLAYADDPVSAETDAALAPLRARLLERRAARVRPGFDDKVLADWNGLMIAALADAATTFGEADWLSMAETAYRFIMDTLRVPYKGETRLHHVWRAGQVQHVAMVDDLANMMSAALTLYEATGSAAYLADAETLAAELDTHYWDGENGGYFFTADDADALITRTRTVHDNATPAANGTLPGTFTRLALATGKSVYLDRADTLIRAFAGELQHNVFPMGTWLQSFETRLRPVEIALIGEPAETGALKHAVYSLSLPTRIVTQIAEASALPEAHPAKGKEKADGRATAYVCVGQTCSLPITEPEVLRSALLEARSHRFAEDETPLP